MVPSDELFKLINDRNVVPLLPPCPNASRIPSANWGANYVGEPPNLANIQGDVFPLFTRKVEDFIFFVIRNNTRFRTALRTVLQSELLKPTTSIDAINHLGKICDAKAGSPTNWPRVDLVQTQIAFSRAGLNFLGQRESTGDSIFDKGSMRQNKYELGDRADWDSIFDKGTLHGVIIVTASNAELCAQRTKLLKRTFQFLPEDVTVISGEELEGQKEHFGFRDGISQPAPRGITKPHKGQIEVDPGVIIMGYTGDPALDKPRSQQRPAWTKDGSIMVFRKLEQDVLGFDEYVKKQWRKFVPGGGEYPKLNDEQGAAMFGARIIGRWKSGAPLVKAQFADDEEMGADPERNNDFDYTIPGEMAPSDRLCPFTAHARKVTPRNLDPYIQKKFLESAMIMRAAITYGPTVTPATKDDKRGLLFVCYQSSLKHGFHLQTIGFANNDYFPVTLLQPMKHGQDPVIGGPPGLPDQEFMVTSRGGEYFFVPSISTLRELAQG